MGHNRRALLTALVLGPLATAIYFGMATNWKGKITQELDHYNALARAFRQGRLDINDTPITDELSFFEDKWYPFYGPLPALPIALLQITAGRDFIPTLYPNIAAAGLGVSLTYLLLTRFKRVYFPKGSFSPLTMTLLLAFGTVFFWLATRSGVWFQVQIFTYLLSVLGLLPLVTEKRTHYHYLLSTLFLSLNLFTRPHTVLLLSIPALLFLLDQKKISPRTILTAGSPFLLLLTVFFGYNYARFNNIFETGYRYHQFHYLLLHRFHLTGHWFHPRYILPNLWQMTLEIPRLTIEQQFTPRQHLFLDANPQGNSIFFMTPPLLAIFLALPFREKNRAKKKLLWALWTGTILTLIPILMLFGTGWQQLGYRYTLDVTAPLLLLVIFGIQGRPNCLFAAAAAFSVFLWTLGVTSP